MDAWLGATIDTHDGRSIGFSPDEEDERLPLGMSFGTQIPGGFGQGRLVVARPAGLDALEAPLLAKARFYGPDGRTAYMGRVAAQPHFGANEIEIALEGPGAAFDDEPFRFLYATRDLSQWGSPSVERRITLMLAGPPNTPHQADAQVITDDTGGPALRMAVAGAWDGTTSLPRVEAWLDAGAGLSVALVLADFDGWNDTNWILAAFTADDDITPVDSTIDLYTAASGQVAYTPAEDHRWAGLLWTHNGVGGNANFEFAVNLRRLAAYGPHGLALYDAEDGGQKGVRGDDVLRHAIGLGAPDVPIEYIEPAIFTIGELVFDDWAGRVRSVIERVTLLGGAQDTPNDWGVYENGFFWRSPGSYGRTHTLRIDDGVVPDGEGEESLELGNAIVATYTDAAGVQRAVGYPGSGADTESPLLLDADPHNPVAYSAVRLKVINKDLGKTSAEGAIILARLALKEAVQTTRVGAYTVPELTNGEPPFYLRAGDRVMIEDGYAREQPVVQTDYDHAEGKVQATIGRPATRLDVYLAELAVA